MVSLFGNDCQVVQVFQSIIFEIFVRIVILKKFPASGAIHPELWFPYSEIIVKFAQVFQSIIFEIFVKFVISKKFPASGPFNP